MKLAGINVAPITPRRDVGFESDLGATLELLDYLCNAGVHGIALLGSTGEFPHLSLEGRAHLTRLAVKRSRVPIVAGVTHSTFDGTVTLAQQAVQAGAAAVLVMPPYFFPYGQAEIREFYLRFADRIAGAIPIYLYNIPLFTRAKLRDDTACDCLRSGGFVWYRQIRAAVRKISLVSLTLRGNEPFQFPWKRWLHHGRTAGADGGVSGCACAVPELMLALNAAILRADGEKIQRLDDML